MLHPAVRLLKSNKINDSIVRNGRCGSDLEPALYFACEADLHAKILGEGVYQT